MLGTNPQLLSAKKIISHRDDICEALEHTCEAHFCRPMSEQDLIQIGKIQWPIICPALYVCKFRQIHMCDSSCDDYLQRTNGTCQKTGVYHGHPESGFMRTPTYKVLRKPTASSVAAQSNMDNRTVSTTFVKREKAKRPNFAKVAIIGGDTPPPPPPIVVEPPVSKRQKVSDTTQVNEEKSMVMKEDEEREEEEELEVEEKGDDFWGYDYRMKMEKKRKNALANPEGLSFRKKKEPTQASLRRQAVNIIRDLFHSNARNLINEERRNLAAECSKRQIKAYRQQKKETNCAWLVHDVLKIDANERLVKDHMKTPPRDETLMEYFASVILRSWEIVNNSPWGKSNQGRVKFDNHCLGTLYYMRTGYSPHQVIYIPKHEYMLFLPLVNDLKTFGYPKSGVKSGMKVIANSYDSARLAKWTASQLRMENKLMSQNHGKVSKMYE